MNHTSPGFTLIELLIVIAVIGILAAVLIPTLLGARKRAYDTSAVTCAKSIQTVQGIFQVDQRRHFEVSKAGGAAGVPTLTDTDPVNPVTDLTEYADDLNENCSVAEVDISTVSADGAGYQVIVLDSRGSQRYTVTGTGLINAAQ